MEPGLVSITTHPITEQLLAVDSTGGVHSLTVSLTGTLLVAVVWIAVARCSTVHLLRCLGVVL